MNPRRWLNMHPLVLWSAATMQGGGLSPDGICRAVDDALIPTLPNNHDRGEVIRTLRRILKSEEGRAEK